HALPVDAPESGIDDQHEELAAKWLGDNFPADVVQPVRLHVAAKRFLCATDSLYFQQLSPPSQLSLRLQGGPMSTIEVRQFLENPHYRDAVSLRRWDDEAKIVGLQTPSVEQFTEVMIQVLSA
ncbi:MAG: metal-dependent phosphohydrolase, partial [Pirellulaceae bacterium]|nr:metal-dependent phosphohydrolase [Pirellulaceae bacterium]